MNYDEIDVDKIVNEVSTAVTQGNYRKATKKESMEAHLAMPSPVFSTDAPDHVPVVVFLVKPSLSVLPCILPPSMMNLEFLIKNTISLKPVLPQITPLTRTSSPRIALFF